MENADVLVIWLAVGAALGMAAFSPVVNWWRSGASAASAALIVFVLHGNSRTALLVGAAVAAAVWFMRARSERKADESA